MKECKVKGFVMPRDLQIALLNDDYGISEETWVLLKPFIDPDLIELVDAGWDDDGSTRIWLEEGWEEPHVELGYHTWM